MPFVIYIFTVFSFALGLAEFVSIGLADVMAGDLRVTPEGIGNIVSSYALEATFSAPILTALFNGLSCKMV
ncbi:MFS transporter [Rodentibacter genomosp. 2]|uniref:MFS transporter n=1 Tax=Rodentibacter genomosp. 2 TaxID=1908266 RepID=UPI001ABF2A64